MSRLIAFLQHKMKITEVYQPVILRELLLNDGRRTQDDLAEVLASRDRSTQLYFRKIVMRWPKTTLINHGVINYERDKKTFVLAPGVIAKKNVDEAIRLCDEKIADWQQRKAKTEKDPVVNDSVRYRVLRAAKGKCLLCGIPSSLMPIDIDHIVPKSRADRYGRITKKNGVRMNINDESNLQALCTKCNRAKRDTDNTDFRRTNKLVRDKILDKIRSEGRVPKYKKLSKPKLVPALNEKLIEEHEEYIRDRNIGELADMVEVIFGIAKQKGFNKTAFMQEVQKKRDANGAFNRGFFYEGDKG